MMKIILFHDITEYNKSIGITENPQDLQPLQSTGADYAMYVPDPKKKSLNPAVEWNNSKIVFTPEQWNTGSTIRYY